MPSSQRRQLPESCIESWSLLRADETNERALIVRMILLHPLPGCRDRIGNEGLPARYGDKPTSGTRQQFFPVRLQPITICFKASLPRTKPRELVRVVNLFNDHSF